jgi:glycosyltransferase involved in cell wall biosynthesis
VACVESILANRYLHELIVIDQSDGLETGEQLAPITDPRLRYERVESRGVCSARNRGTELSTGLIVAATDDDCRVPSNWLESYEKVFGDNPEAAVVCGRVTVPPELFEYGYAVSFEPRQREWRKKFPPPAEWGITANMAIRRTVFDTVGPFDKFLGSGAPLTSGGEPDLLYRVLRHGLLVVNAGEVEVTHVGIRKHGLESQKLIRGYSAGISAAFLKHVRAGDLVAARVYSRFLLTIIATVGANMVRRRKPTGAGVFVASLKGARASFRFGVDRATRMYVQR